MDQPIQPKGPRPEETRSRIPSAREAGRLVWEHPEALAVGAAVVHGVAHVMKPEAIPLTDNPTEEETEETESHWVQEKVELFEVIYSGEPDLVYFYTPEGKVLKIVKIPSGKSEKVKSDFIKKKKRELASQTPVLVDGIALSFPGHKGEKSLVDTATERSLETFHDERYFGNEETSIKEAMWKIAEAYEIPVEIALGFAANQSLMATGEVDHNASGELGGRGLFKITGDAYEEALGYMSRNEEFGGKVRTGKLENLANEWKNPFVQIEVFCAYYRKLRLILNNENGAVTLLEARLKELDPNFSKDIIEELSIVSAYHSGPTRIRKVVSAFVKLSDEEIKKRIGVPPYWIDVWPKLLADSLGEGGVDQKSLDFTSKIYAMASLMGDEGENYVEEATKGKSNWFRGVSSFMNKAAGVVAMATGIEGARRAVKAHRTPGSTDLSRRKFLGGAAAVAALSVPGASAAEALLNADWDSSEEIPEVKDLGKEEIPMFKEAIGPAKKSLDARYEELKKAKRIFRTNAEKNDVRRYLQPEQDRLLKGTFDKILGKDLNGKILNTKKQAQSKRNALYDEADKKAKAYRDEKLKDGTFVRLNEDNGTIYFCEQVGKESGTSNNPDCLVVHKDLIPLLGSVIELVNHQIDLFNADPAAYGKKGFPKIPHITAIKICGAFREPSHTKRMLNGRQAGRTTRSPSAHWSGQALDLASLATQGAHVVRFKEPMLDEKGEVAIPADGKLPTGGFGNTTRQLISTFIGRALMSLREPLMKANILEIMPIWEGGQSNWHMATKPL